MNTGLLRQFQGQIAILSGTALLRAMSVRHAGLL